MRSTAHAKVRIHDLEGAMKEVEIAVEKLALQECLRCRKEPDAPPVIPADELDMLIPWLEETIAPAADPFLL